MDKFTIRNLEFLGNSDTPTLFSTLNNTVSPMGARLLRRWMLMPLNDVAQINERLKSVKYFIKTKTVNKESKSFYKPLATWND